MRVINSTLKAFYYKPTAWAAVIFAGLLAAPAMSQVPAPPVLPHIDSNGVNPIDGSFNTSATDILIGPDKSHGLAYERFWTGSGWRSSAVATMSGNGMNPAVSIGGSTETFTRTSSSVSGSTYQNDGSSSSSLIREGGSGSDYVYTSADGTIVRFMPSSGGTLSQFDSQLGWARSVTWPDGTIEKFTYKSTTYSASGSSIPVSRVQSINNNRGYQLKFSYVLNNISSSADVDGWQMPSRITAINNAVEYCDPAVDSCTLINSWPHSDYTYAAGVYSLMLSEVSDFSGRTWRYGYDYYSNRLSSIRRPGSASNDTNIAYVGTPGVSSIQRLGVTWNYSYVDDYNYNRVTTVTDQNSKTRKVYSNTLQNIISSQVDQLGLVTTIVNTGQGSYYDEIQSITFPEGNSKQYSYDSRGNVTSIIQHSKPGSGLADIVVSAGYSAACANLKVCNKPVWTRGANGKQTDYTYDGTHGGVLTITAPAPSTGAARPQLRNTYTLLQSYYKNSAGTAVASGQIYLPSQTSACKSGASCSGTVDEVISTTGYGPQITGTANNLLPVTASVGAGNGSLTATTTNSYDAIGNMTYSDGPMAGSADTSRTIYDAVRQVVGVIGPDPDGAGPLKNRAVRFSYNADGQTILAEAGTTAGQSDANWSAFASLQQLVTAYDANGRAISVSTMAGGQIYAVTQASYDVLGRLDCTVRRMNSATWGSLPASACTAQLASSFGPDRIIKKTYDDVGHLTMTQSGFGTGDQADDVTNLYTQNGLIAAATDAQGNTTTFEYDGFDRLSKTRYPSIAAGSRTSSMTDYEQLLYDPASNVISRRLRGYSTDSTRHIDYTYDDLNRVVVKDLPGNEKDVAFTYDLFNQPLSSATSTTIQSFTYDALGRNVTQSGPLGMTTTAYDLAGRRTSFAWPDSFYVTYDYLVTGEPTAIRQNGATSGIGVLATFSYDDLGRRISIARGNGTATAYTPDPVSRLSSMAQDLQGTINDVTLGFTYNPAGQIVTTTRSNDSYAWRGAANRNDASSVNGLNQVTTVGSGNISYDPAGNLSSTGASGYTYSSENLLLTGPLSATLYYDPLMRLYQESGGGIATTLFQYDGHALIGEYNSSGVLQKRYVQGLEAEDPLVEYDASGNRTWLHSDERGTIIARTNDSGASLAINSYDEYGVPGSGNAGRFGYTGQTWLPSLGLWYYKARIYSSRLGRFMQADPAGYSDSMNLYGYVRGDPVNGTDPTGLTTGSNIDTGPGLCPSCAGTSVDFGPSSTSSDPDRIKGYQYSAPQPGGVSTYLLTQYSDGTASLQFLRFSADGPSGIGGGAIGSSSQSEQSQPGDIVVVGTRPQLPIPRGYSRGLEPYDLGLSVNILAASGSIGIYGRQLQIYVNFLEGSGGITRQGLRTALSTAKSLGLSSVSISAIIANEKLEGLMVPSSALFRAYPGTELIIAGPITTVIIPVR